MKKLTRITALLLASMIILSACAPAGDGPGADLTDAPDEIKDISTGVVDAELTATVTLGNWPPDTAPVEASSIWTARPGLALSIGAIGASRFATLESPGSS